MDLRFGPTLTVPIDFVTARVALLGMSGAGKSNAFAVMVEAVYDAGGVFTYIDPFGAAWGLRASADGTGPGLNVPIIGGYHGDLPLRPDAGALLARELYQLDASAVLDLSAFTPQEQALFVAAYANELFSLHLRHKKARSVFLDEAAQLAPQRPNSEADNASAIALWRLHTGGRAQGIGLKTATQSAADQDKRTIKQAELVVALRTFSPLDQKPVVDYLRTSVEREKADEIKRTLAGLKDGEAWFVSPKWLDVVKRARFALRRTFDSGATPKVGVSTQEPVILAPVELDRLRLALERDVDTVAGDDPVALRAYIAQLEKRLESRATASTRVERVEVQVLPENALSELRSAVTALVDAGAEATLAARVIDHAIDEAKSLRSTPPVVDGAPSKAAAPVPAIAERAPRRSMPPSPSHRAGTALKAGARRMLDRLAACGGVLTKVQLATLAQVRRSSGTFAEYLRTLAGLEYVTIAGDLVTITDHGAAAIGVTIRTQPPRVGDVVSWYRSELKAGARRMLDLLVAAYPRAISKDALAGEASVNRASGTFAEYVRTLSGLGLIEEIGNGVRDGRKVRAHATLFLHEPNR